MRPPDRFRRYAAWLNAGDTEDQDGADCYMAITLTVVTCLLAVAIIAAVLVALHIVGGRS